MGIRVRKVLGCVCIAQSMHNNVGRCSSAHDPSVWNGILTTYDIYVHFCAHPHCMVCSCVILVKNRRPCKAVRRTRGGTKGVYLLYCECFRIYGGLRVFFEGMR